MVSTARDILGLVAEIGGDKLACRAGKACSGRRLNISAASLGRADHPLRTVLGKSATARLIERLAEVGSCRTVIRFPEAVESEYVRDCRERAEIIRRSILDGHSVRATARAAKVHSRTVGNHRARLRAQGLLTSGSARG